MSAYSVAPVWALGRKNWAVLDQDGNRVSYVVPDRERALVLLEQHQRRAARLAAQTPRVCMVCETPMLSEGPHHRLCPRCRREANDCGLF